MSFSVESTAITHVGRVRKINEDACLDRADIGLWVVADGMGGHEAGDVASQAIVEVLDGIKPPDNLGGFVESIEDRLISTNEKLIQMAAGSVPAKTIGSTVAILLSYQQFALVIWVGDSRVYRLRENNLEMMTQDHSHVEDLIGQGMLSRSEAASHPSANVITRAVGADETLYLDMSLDTVRATDRYLLCSDGLDKELSQPEIAKLLGAGSCQEAADSLIDTALSRGSRDNVTVITVAFSHQGE